MGYTSDSDQCSNQLQLDLNFNYFSFVWGEGAGRASHVIKVIVLITNNMWEKQ